MENILRELFGKTDDEPAVAPAASPGVPADSTDETRQAHDAEREARRARRKERKADQERVRGRQDFFDRYVAGAPSEGFTAEEALQHLAEMQDELSPGEFQWAMVQTLDRLPADQRDEFLAMMRQHRETQGTASAATDTAPAAAKPAAAGAAASASAVSAAPGSAAGDPFGGLLSGLLGGSAGGASGGGASGFNVGSLLDDLRQQGFGAPEPSGEKPTEADFTALINSPLGKAVLGGLAAYGMQAAQADDDDETPAKSGA